MKVVTPCFANNSFNNVIKVILLFGALALFTLCFFRRSETDSVPWEVGPGYSQKGLKLRPRLNLWLVLAEGHKEQGLLGLQPLLSEPASS